MIELKKDEFAKVREYIRLALKVTEKPAHRKLMRKNLGVSWNKMNNIYEDLITSTKMSDERVKDFKKFLNNTLKKLEACKETEKHAKKNFNITIAELKKSIK